MSGVLDQLERVQQVVATAKRHSLRAEAPWERTRPLVEFSLAWGFARAGSPRIELATRALATIPQDEVVGRFVARLAEWRLAAPGDLNWPTEIEGLFRNMEALARFHAGRTLTHMQSLEPWRQPDPFAEFERDKHLGSGRGQPADWPLRPRASPDALTELLGAGETSRGVERLRIVSASRSAAVGGTALLERFLDWFSDEWPRATDPYTTNRF